MIAPGAVIGGLSLAAFLLADELWFMMSLWPGFYEIRPQVAGAGVGGVFLGLALMVPGAMLLASRQYVSLDADALTITARGRIVTTVPYAAVATMRLDTGVSLDHKQTLTLLDKEGRTLARINNRIAGFTALFRSVEARIARATGRAPYDRTAERERRRQRSFTMRRRVFYGCGLGLVAYAVFAAWIIHATLDRGDGSHVRFMRILLPIILLDLAFVLGLFLGYETDGTIYAPRTLFQPRRVGLVTDRDLEPRESAPDGLEKGYVSETPPSPPSPDRSPPCS